MELTQTEVERFWEMGCALEAMFVPKAELERAFAEGRMQYASSYSVMGTGDLGWKRADVLPTRWLYEYAIVPPGRQAEDWPYERMLDERDTEYWLWQPFRAEQDSAIARVADPIKLLDIVLTHVLEAPAAKAHDLLRDWLISGDAIAPEIISAELATTHAQAPAFLRDAVRARWVTRSAAGLLGAVSTLEIPREGAPGRARRMAVLHRVVF